MNNRIKNNRIKNNILPITLWIVYGALLIEQTIKHSVNSQAIIYFTILFFGTALVKYFQSKNMDWFEFGIFVIVLLIILLFF